LGVRKPIPCDVGDDVRIFEPTVKKRELSLIVAGLSQIRKELGTPKAIIWRPPRQLGSKGSITRHLRGILNGKWKPSGGPDDFWDGSEGSQSGKKLLEGSRGSKIGLNGLNR